MSLQLPPTARKPSEAKSVDSGYDGGPSRETSASHLPSSKQSHKGKETSSEQISMPHRSNSTMTGVLESSTNHRILEASDSCSSVPTTNERYGRESLRDNATPDSKNGAFSSIGDEGFRCKSEPYLLSMEDETNMAALDNSLNIAKVNSDWGMSSNVTPSQPSFVQFTQNTSSINVMLSSSDSLKNLTINITISSPESQTQPSQSDSRSEPNSSMHMTSEEEEVLKRTIIRNTNVFVRQTHFETLIPFLFQKRLIHEGDSETLESFASHKSKGNHFYTVILPRKGKRAYRKLHSCLRRETEHLGHQDLVALLDNALSKQQDPQSSSDNSPAEEYIRADFNSHPLSMCDPTPSSKCDQNLSVSNINENTNIDDCSHPSCTTTTDSPICCHSDFPPNNSSCHGSSTCHGEGDANETTSKDNCLKSKRQTYEFERDNRASSKNKTRAAKGCCTLL